MDNQQNIVETNCADEQVGSEFKVEKKFVINLTDDLVVTADEYQYIVGEPRQRKGRGLEMRHPRYYSTMAQAVNGALSTTLRHGVSDGTIDTLQKFLQEAERIIGDFRRKLEPWEC